MAGALSPSIAHLQENTIPLRGSRRLPQRNDPHRPSHEKGWDVTLVSHGKDWEWLQEQADRVLVGWLNQVAVEMDG